MDLTAISLFCEDAQTPPGYLVSLYADEKGQPGDQALGSAGFVPSNKNWITVPINHIPLLVGKTYHLVVEQDKNRGGEHPVGIIGPANFASFSFTDFPNRIIPQDESRNPQEDVLAFEKGSWRSLNCQPLYALHGGGVHIQGDPYESAGAFPVYGGSGEPGVIQGEALHPHCPINPTGFAIRVKKKGNPTSPLNYKVYTTNYQYHTASFSFGGMALKPEQVTESFQWVTFGIKLKDYPRPFTPECTYVVLQSDSGHSAPGKQGCQDCYLLSEVGNNGGLPMAAEMSFDGGPHLSRAVYSIDGGKTWVDKFEWDANIVILGDACPSPEAPEIKPVPTPEILPRTLSP